MAANRHVAAGGVVAEELCVACARSHVRCGGADVVAEVRDGVGPNTDRACSARKTRYEATTTRGMVAVTRDRNTRVGDVFVAFKNDVRIDVGMQRARYQIAFASDA